MSLSNYSMYRNIDCLQIKSTSEFNDLKPGNCGTDENIMAVNSKYIALSWKSFGGGMIAVMDINAPGKIDPEMPMLHGHTSDVSCLAWDPFDSQRLVTGAKDGSVIVWNLPESITENITVTEDAFPIKLPKKITDVAFHPTAKDLLVVVSFNMDITIYDLSNNCEVVSYMEFPKAVASVAWNKEGSLAAVACRDSTIRIVDFRAQQIVNEFFSHTSSKPNRLVWEPTFNFIISVGVNMSPAKSPHAAQDRKRGRQVCYIDPETGDRVHTFPLDDLGSSLFVDYDEDLHLLYILSRGQTVIYVFEILDSDPKHYVCNAIAGPDAMRSFGCLPKLAVETEINEIHRIYHLSTDKISPLRLEIPRRNAGADTSLYPETRAAVPALRAAEWKEGKIALPTMCSIFKQEDVQKAAVEEREITPVVEKEPTPEPKPNPKPVEEPTPEPVVEKEPTPEPVVEKEPTPEPVVEKTPTPEPIVEKEPTPEPEESKPVADECKDPVEQVEDVPAVQEISMTHVMSEFKKLQQQFVAFGELLQEFQNQ
ncbi:hypothetical protein PCE1_000960 [Barthelona sp. PCE]